VTGASRPSLTAKTGRSSGSGGWIIAGPRNDGRRVGVGSPVWGAGAPKGFRADAERRLGAGHGSAPNGDRPGCDPVAVMPVAASARGRRGTHSSAADAVLCISSAAGLGPGVDDAKNGIAGGGGDRPGGRRDAKNGIAGGGGGRPGGQRELAARGLDCAGVRARPSASGFDSRFDDRGADRRNDPRDRRRLDRRGRGRRGNRDRLHQPDVVLERAALC
jgi:hypothetical protein